MKISEIIAMDPGTLGYLDWFSGMLFMNTSKETWHRCRDSGSPPAFGTYEQNLVHTFTHETFHFLQITTAGYLYHFACRLFTEMSALIGGPFGYDELEVMLANPPRPTPAIEQLFAEINHAPKPLVSVRALVESAAYLYEHRVHLADFTDAGFREVLRRERPPAEYHVAYDVLHDACGADAFHNLLPLSLLALCFADPASAFPMLTAAAIAKNAVYKTEADLRLFLSLVDEFPDTPFFGSAADVANQYQQSHIRQHPVYYPAILNLDRLSAEISPFRLVMEPSSMTVDIAASVLRPMRFNDGQVSVPPRFDELVGPGANDLLFTLSVLAALSHRITSYGEARVRPQR